MPHSIFFSISQTMLSRVDVTSAAKYDVPRPEPLDPFRGRNGLSSTSVVILDTKTILIENFIFRGLAPGGFADMHR